MIKKIQLFSGVLFICALICFGTANLSLASNVASSHQAASEVADATIPLLDETHGAEAAEHDLHGSDPLSAEKLKDFGWRIVNFIALMIILVKFAAKPLGLSLSSRKEQIANEIGDLEQRRMDAEKAYKEFQEKLDSVEADIDKIVERAIAQAEIEKGRILEKAEASAEEMKRAAEQAVANEIAEARTHLREEVAEKAAAMAEEIIKKSLKTNDQKVIIENYLDKVGAMS